MNRRRLTRLPPAMLAAALCAGPGLVHVRNVEAQAPGAQRFVVLGCLSREAPARGAKPGPEAFTIRDPRGEGATYRVDGDPEVLRLHVGRTVEIAGTITPPTASSGANAVPTLKVASMTYIAPTCVYKTP